MSCRFVSIRAFVPVLICILLTITSVPELNEADAAGWEEPLDDGDPVQGQQMPVHTREGHGGTISVPVTLAFSAQMYPFFYDNGYHLNQTRYNDVIFAGADWKGAQHYNPDMSDFLKQYGMLMSGYDYFYSRSYLAMPFEPEPEGKVLDAQLIMTTRYDIAFEVPLYTARVMEQWDMLYFGNPTDDRFIFEFFPDVKFDYETDPTFFESQSNTPLGFNVTGIVQKWFNGTPNNGICIRSTEAFEPINSSGSYHPTKYGTSFFYGLGSAHPPELKIEYVLNEPPRAEITTKSHPPSKVSAPIRFTGMGTDPDGDGIALYKWTSDRDGLLGIGPDMSEIIVDNLSVGMHEIRFSVQDDFAELPKWSSPAIQYINILENTPEIVRVDAREVGKTSTGFEFRQGTLVDITVDVDGGAPPLSGWVNISYWINKTRMITKAALDDDLTYTWDTSAFVPDMYMVHVVVKDSSGRADTEGLYGKEPELLLVITDEAPPHVQEVWTVSSDGDVRSSFRKGDTVTIKARERNSETGLTGEVKILDMQGIPAVSSKTLSPMDEAGVYSVQMETEGFTRGGEYTIQVILKDMAGNIGLGETLITLTDTDAPELATVIALSGSQMGTSFPLATTITIQARENSGEEGLTGIIDIEYDDDYVLFSETMTEMGDGIYYYTWQTRDLLQGWYSINITLVDEEGNQDPDGLGHFDLQGTRMPDLEVRLTEPPAGLVVIDSVPMAGDWDVPPETMLLLEFSMTVNPVSVNEESIGVHTTDGNQVTGKWHVDDSGKICRFDPAETLAPNTGYLVEVTESVETSDGDPASPYSFGFKTTDSRVSEYSNIQRVPEDRMVYIPAGENMTFSVGSPDQVDMTVEWYLNDKRVQGESGNDYTLNAEGDLTGENILEVRVVGSESDMMPYWKVMVFDMGNGTSSPGSEPPDGSEEYDAGSDAGGPDWPLMAAIVLLIIAVFVNILFMLYRKGGKSGKDGGNNRGNENKRSDGDIDRVAKDEMNRSSGGSRQGPEGVR